MKIDFSEFFFCYIAKFLGHPIKESELYPFYPASKAVRVQNPNISLLESNGELNGLVRRRSRGADYVIFCLSSSKDVNETNIRGLLKINKNFIAHFSSWIHKYSKVK